MSERKYYCICESDCKFETMTKEQILAAIAQAAENGLVFDTDAAFITKVRESNAGKYITFWIGTQAQYNALAAKEENCLYIITDNDAPAKLDETLLAAQDAVDLAAAAKTYSISAATANGICTDALAIDIDDNYAAANKPQIVNGIGNNESANVPDDLMQGVREVFILDRAAGWYVVKITGLDNANCGAVWVNWCEDGQSWNGWRRMQDAEQVNQIASNLADQAVTEKVVTVYKEVAVTVNGNGRVDTSTFLGDNNDASKVPHVSVSLAITSDNTNLGQVAVFAGIPSYDEGNGWLLSLTFVNYYSEQREVTANICITKIMK